MSSTSHSIQVTYGNTRSLEEVDSGLIHVSLIRTPNEKVMNPITGVEEAACTDWTTYAHEILSLNCDGRSRGEFSIANRKASPKSLK